MAQKYQVLPLKKLAISIFSGITPKSGGDAYSSDDSGILFVKSGSLSTDGTLTIDETSKIKPHIHDGRMCSSQLQYNDILIAIVGATIGKVAIYQENRQANINQAIAAVRVNTEMLLPDFLVAYLLSPIGQLYLEYLKRPVARANINLEEIGEIGIPILSKEQQKRFIDSFYAIKKNKIIKLQQADDLVDNAKRETFASIGILFPEYIPSLFSYTTLADVREYGFGCNPHSNYLNKVFEELKNNKYYRGRLSNYIDVNPITKRSKLEENAVVSFVPMQNVYEFINYAEYETRKYSEVKIGFTIFNRGDLLWAKITPCMQNGKSFVAQNLPTEVGFGSTEFHVLRIKAGKEDEIYMPYLWILLSEQHILEAAQGMFSGSAGQQRVPDVFLKNFPVVLPKFEIQKKLANMVLNALDKSIALKKEAETNWKNAKEQFERELLGGINYD